MFRVMIVEDDPSTGALLLRLVKRQAFDPLTAMARRLGHLHAGTADPVPLPEARSKAR